MWKWASLPGTFRYTQGKLDMQRQSYLLFAYKTQLLVAFITTGIICVGAPPYAGGQALTGSSIVREQGFGPVLNEGSSALPHNSPAAGAVNIIVDNPRFHNIVYVGSVSGGVWVTFDAYSAFPTWFPLTDGFLPELSVNSLAISPVNPSAIFAGTGSTSSYDRINNNSGIGVARSLDAGLSWKVFAGSTFIGRTINSIVPTGLDSGNIILAATWQDQGGVWRSIDNGESFHRISGNATAGLPDAGVTSLIGDPLKPKVFYAAVPQASQGSPPGGIYRSDDGGLTWKNISDGIRRYPIPGESSSPFIAPP
jgi:hypothetical protein